MDSKTPFLELTNSLTFIELLTEQASISLGGSFIVMTCPARQARYSFRILLFKLFNKIETWQILERSFGPITFEDFCFSSYDERLERARRDGQTIYSAAYIMPPGKTTFGYKSKHRNHLLLLEQMMADRLPQQLEESDTMKDGFEKLRPYPTIGDFLAYQFITDVKLQRDN